LGQVYVQRIGQGIAQNLEQEQTIAAFQQAISRYHSQTDRSSEMSALTELDNFLDDQSRYPDAIAYYGKSLEIAREIGNLQGEAASLNNLGTAYHSLGQYQRVIDFHQQSLEIEREIGDRHGEANSLMGLGNAYRSLRQYQRAIDFHQQSLEIEHEIGDRSGEAISLVSLGSAYHDLGQYDQAIDFLQQSLDMFRNIGDRHDEANSLFNLAGTLAKLGQTWQALQYYQEAQQIYQSLELEHMVEQCVDAIYGLNRIIPVQQPAPERTPLPLPDWWEKSLPAPPHRPKPQIRPTTVVLHFDGCGSCPAAVVAEVVTGSHRSKTVRFYQPSNLVCVANA
jgi:tetratricopeptide (TPR) repeat protein